MNNSWICPVCGGNSQHFNSNRCCIVCDTCGTEVRSDAQRNEDISFQQNMALARQHLQVGNWDEVKRIVKPYTRTRPAEKQVYLYLLAATTKCFEDYLLDNPAADAEAAEYWDKLVRLGCVNSAMRSYLERRAEKVRARNFDFKDKCLILTIIDSVLTLITISMIMFCGSISIIFIVLTIVGWVHTCKWIKRNHAKEG